MKYWLSILLLLVCARVVAQDSTKAKLLARMRLIEYTGGIVVLRAAFENVPDSLNFILDSGSGGASLDSSTCAMYNIQSQKTDSTVLGIGGAKKVEFVFNRSLRFPGLTVENMNFHVNDYSLLTSVYGEKIDGLLGYNFFSRYILNFNFDNNTLDVYSKGAFTYPKGGYFLKPHITTIPSLNVTIEDERSVVAPMYLDSGAGLCLLFGSKFIKDSSLLKSRRKLFVTQAEGMSGKVSMFITVVKEIKLGPYKFRDVPAYLYDDRINVLSYPKSVGLLGNELMRKFNSIYNYSKNEIFIKRNSRYYYPFDYSYTGLSIYVHDEKIMVEEIVKDSPADLAGLKVDDEIVGVGVNFSGNIQVYKDLLNIADTQVKITLIRNKKVSQVTMQTANILKYNKRKENRKSK